jgi:DNA polymerase III sliding clamp (beta) subunit (PCNA family)
VTAAGVNLQTGVRLWFRQKLDAVGSGRGRLDVVVDPGELVAALAELDGGQVTLHVDDATLQVTCDAATRTLERHGETPSSAPKVVGLTPLDELAPALRVAKVAAGTDTARPVLTAVVLRAGRVVASDSIRLARVEVPALQPDTDVLVPCDLVRLAVGARGARLSWAADERRVRLYDRATRRDLVATQIVGTFPDDVGLLPTVEPEGRVTVSRQALAEVTKAAAAEAGARTALQLCPGERHVECKLTADGTQLSWQLDAEVAGHPPPVAVNPKLLAAMASRQFAGERLSLAVHGTLRPMQVTDGSATVCLLMPARLG